MIIPSIFLDSDPKKHMSINLENGLWQCFKTGRRGNFIHLVSILENKKYKEVYNEFLWKMLEAECEGKNIQKVREKIVSNFMGTDPDEKWIPIEEAPLYVHEYLVSRYLDQGPSFNPNFYYNPVSERLVIPYRDASNMIYFYQERALRSGQEPKYLNFKGVKSSSILYQYDVDSFRGLYICEGVLDALSLKLLGYNATTTISCNASKEQLNQLKHYNGKLVVAYDNDEAGTKGIRRFDRQRKRMRMEPVFYCQPPKEYKDWNAFLVASGDEFTIKNHIKENTKIFDDDLYEATQL